MNNNNDNDDRRFYQVIISLWCLLLGLNIYWGVSAYLKGDWGGVVIPAIMIGWLWKNIWRDFDESRGITHDDDERT